VRDDRQRLGDALKAIERILEKTTSGRQAFESDEMLQVWVLHHFQIVGEAARGLSEEFRRRHPDDDWRQAAGLRHILVHEYFRIDPEQIWKIVERDLVPMKRKIESILAQEES
jgi:uncharacterized protein with HEPN domain